MNQLELEPQPTYPQYRRIHLTQGQFAIVDADDADRINAHRWSARYSPDKKSFYAIRQSEGNNGTILMSREILGVTEFSDVLVDHRNRVTLDNRKENLRRATSAQNAANRKRRSDSKQPYKGVSLWRYGRWRAEIQTNGVRMFLGQFATPELARDAYISAATSINGEFACDGSAEVHEIDYERVEILPRVSLKRKGPRPTRPTIVQPEDPSIRHIALTRGSVAIVDASDYDDLMRFWWSRSAPSSNGKFYAVRSLYENGKHVHIWMHKYVMGASTDEIVDHENRDTLDCRKSNLRVASSQQNCANASLRKDNLSGLKGVSQRGKRWFAQISIKGRTRGIGTFDTPEAAHAAYCVAARELHGEFAYTGPSPD